VGNDGDIAEGASHIEMSWLCAVGASLFSETSWLGKPPLKPSCKHDYAGPAR
jgi:hypothetical protein